jgi:hypothetical protein
MLIKSTVDGWCALFIVSLVSQELTMHEQTTVTATPTGTMLQAMPPMQGLVQSVLTGSARRMLPAAS